MRVIVNPKYAHLQKEIEEVPRSFQNEGDVVYDGRNPKSSRLFVAV